MAKEHSRRRLNVCANCLLHLLHYALTLGTVKAHQVQPRAGAAECSAPSGQSANCSQTRPSQFTTSPAAVVETDRKHQTVTPTDFKNRKTLLPESRERCVQPPALRHMLHFAGGRERRRDMTFRLPLDNVCQWTFRGLYSVRHSAFQKVPINKIMSQSSCIYFPLIYMALRSLHVLFFVY